MPLKDYKCKACDKEFEELHLSDDIKPQCPECSSLEVTPVPTAHGGYKMRSGPSSIRPRNAGSFKRGHK